MPQPIKPLPPIETMIAITIAIGTTLILALIRAYRIQNLKRQMRKDQPPRNPTPITTDTEENWVALLKKKDKNPADIQEEETLRHRLEAELDEESKALISELNAVGLGFRVTTIYDLVNTRNSYSQAIPVLIRHLPVPYNFRTKEGIVRSLAIKEATGKANGELFKEYDNAPPEKHAYRWAIGNTIYETVTPTDFENIKRIVLNKENGLSRHMFVMALKKFKSAQSIEVLEILLNDIEMAPYAGQVLKKMKPTKGQN